MATDGGVLIGGLAPEDAVWLSKRLGVIVHAVQSGEDLLAEFQRGQWMALVLDDCMAEPRGVNLLERLRRDNRLSTLPIVYCLDLPVETDLQSALVDRFAVEQILYHPLDREELARQVARALGLPAAGMLEEPTEISRQTTAALAELWDRYRGENLRRVAAIEQAVVHLRQEQLDEATRREAEREAHKLVGALGTFGFHHASEVAREIEVILRGPFPAGQVLSRSRVLEIVEKVALLRRELEGSRGAAGSTEPETRALLLIVDSDLEAANRVATEAWRRGVRPEVVTSPVAAAAFLAREQPDVALIGFAGPADIEDGFALLSSLAARNPPVPVLVTTSRDGLIDRVTAAQLGARGFLPRPLGPVQTLDAINQLLVRLRTTQSTVLAVDDDPSIHGVLHALLNPRGLRLTSLADPLRFWESLEMTSPDLLILDVDMPHLSGIELCRVVRNDPRWSSLPILFLSASDDSETLHRLFSAGADDYVRKPIVGPELVTRLLNRLERTRLLRSLAETDALSGVANRWKSSQMLEQYLRLADRYRQVIAVAVLDLDHFKGVNDQHGHAAGDEVVRRLGCLLRSSFRAEDVVGRWGGEEFVVGMYGMSRRDGVRRMTQLLDSLRAEVFLDAYGNEFQVTLSAGIAQYPEDGRDLSTLYRRADEALYRAKHEGRARVLSAEPLAMPLI